MQCCKTRFVAVFPTVGSLGLLCTFSALPSRIRPVTLRKAVGHVHGLPGSAEVYPLGPGRFCPRALQ